MEFQKGDKVIAIKKTSRKRELDSCASYYMKEELKQDFLYVNGIDEVSSEKVGETCYWCHAIQGGGDSYRESDLVRFKE